MICLICSLPLSTQHFAYAAGSKQAISTVAIADGKAEGTATLFGYGDNFVTDLKLRVKFNGHQPYFITLADGYSPYIGVFDFGAENKLLFFSSQTGGSGGYGNYMIYNLKTDSYQLLYDKASDSQTNTFKAAFQPNGFMTLTNNATQYELTVDVKYMDKTFYDKIFAPDGSLTGEQPYVNDISFVAPELNSASGIWRLVTFRSVASVAEVNRLGYIVQTLDFNNNAFTPTFTSFSISL